MNKQEFKISISYGKVFIEENHNFPRCKSLVVNCSLDALSAQADLLFKLKKLHIIEDFVIYTETL